MQHGKTPLILMAALALPGAAHALGLGEIHVDSPLNQPLAAEIDIVGATAQDLSGITASVANSETFRRFGADRPAFLSSITFKITRDSKGRPVLAIRSTDAFTEPLVNILIDLRWHGGELIRQYALLLDPVVNTSPTLNAEAQPIVGGPAIYAASAAALPADSESVNEASKPATSVTPSSEHTSTSVGEAVAARKTIKVGARATLRGVAWRAGARADSDLKRMMIAIFRANPNAFEGNINRLRRGSVLNDSLGQRSLGHFHSGCRSRNSRSNGILARIDQIRSRRQVPSATCFGAARGSDPGRTLGTEPGIEVSAI